MESHLDAWTGERVRNRFLVSCAPGREVFGTNFLCVAPRWRPDFGGQKASWRHIGPSEKRVAKKQNTPSDKPTFANLNNTSQLICEVAKRWLRVGLKGGGLPALLKIGRKAIQEAKRRHAGSRKGPRKGVERRLEK